jgi:Tfp pilus assembly protein PilP
MTRGTLARPMCLLALAALGLADRAYGQSAVPPPTLSQVKGEVKSAVTSAMPKVPGIPGAAAPAAPLDPVAAAAERVASLRKKTLKDEDFVESEDNRDPFRAYLRLFGGASKAPSGPGPKVPAIFDKFALEELTLIAVISGDEQPRAMFRDPTGLGQTVKRGDYVSKNAARITKILSDRVVVELTEDTGGPEGQRVLEKAILVNPEENQP